MKKNIIGNKLSYFEYLISEDGFRLVDGADLLLTYYLSNRIWDINEDHRTVRISYRTKINSLISKYITEDDLITPCYKDTEDFRDDDISIFDLCTTTIDPVVFIKFAHNHNLDVPVELLEYAGLKVKDKLDWNYVDKIACQAVAKTLWDEHPDMKTEEMINHNAIQLHAGGKTKSPTTLRRWLSEVDRRDSGKKPGPNKSTNYAK